MKSVAHRYSRLLRSFVSFVRLFVCSFVRLFVCSFVRLFVCSFVRLFVCSLFPLFVCSCTRPFVRSLVQIWSVNRTSRVFIIHSCTQLSFLYRTAAVSSPLICFNIFCLHLQILLIFIFQISISLRFSFAITYHHLHRKSKKEISVYFVAIPSC